MLIKKKGKKSCLHFSTYFNFYISNSNVNIQKKGNLVPKSGRSYLGIIIMSQEINETYQSGILITKIHEIFKSFCENTNNLCINNKIIMKYDANYIFRQSYKFHLSLFARG